MSPFHSLFLIRSKGSNLPRGRERDPAMKAALFPALQDFFAWLFLWHNVLLQISENQIHKENTKTRVIFWFNIHIRCSYQYIRTKVTWNYNTKYCQNYHITNARISISVTINVASIFISFEHPGVPFPPVFLCFPLCEWESPNRDFASMLTPTIQLLWSQLHFAGVEKFEQNFSEYKKLFCVC